jgi:hypothetical protein
MRRFSVRSLMILIVVAAIGLAALRNANPYWAGAMEAVVAVSVATSVTAALALRGKDQIGRAGFAVFSIMYLLITVGSVFSDSFKASFPTAAALRYVQSLVSDTGITNSQQRRATLATRIQAFGDSSDDQDPAVQRLKDRLVLLDQMIQEEQNARSRAARWRSWLPGAVRADDFVLIGHSLFALLSGLIGTVVGRVFYARRERSETPTQ